MSEKWDEKKLYTILRYAWKNQERVLDDNFEGVPRTDDVGLIVSAPQLLKALKEIATLAYNCGIATISVVRIKNIADEAIAIQKEG